MEVRLNKWLLPEYNRLVSIEQKIKNQKSDSYEIGY